MLPAEASPESSSFFYKFAAAEQVGTRRPFLWLRRVCGFFGVSVENYVALFLAVMGDGVFRGE